jgi:hypothetical protein
VDSASLAAERVEASGLCLEVRAVRHIVQADFGGVVPSSTAPGAVLAHR